MKVLVIICVILLLNVFFIISNDGLNIKQGGDIKELSSSYGLWAKKIAGNLGDITSNAIKLDWKPISKDSEEG